MIMSTLRPSSVSVIEDDLCALRAALRSDLVLPGDIEFDAARKVQDITVDRSPQTRASAGGTQRRS